MRPRGAKWGRPTLSGALSQRTYVCTDWSPLTYNGHNGLVGSYRYDNACKEIERFDLMNFPHAHCDLSEQELTALRLAYKNGSTPSAPIPSSWAFRAPKRRLKETGSGSPSMAKARKDQSTALDADADAHAQAEGVAVNSVHSGTSEEAGVAGVAGPTSRVTLPTATKRSHAKGATRRLPKKLKEDTPQLGRLPGGKSTRRVQRVARSQNPEWLEGKEVGNWMNGCVVTVRSHDIRADDSDDEEIRMMGTPCQATIVTSSTSNFITPRIKVKYLDFPEDVHDEWIDIVSVRLADTKLVFPGGRPGGGKTNNRASRGSTKRKGKGEGAPSARVYAPSARVYAPSARVYAPFGTR